MFEKQRTSLVRDMPKVAAGATAACLSLTRSAYAFSWNAHKIVENSGLTGNADTTFANNPAQWIADKVEEFVPVILGLAIILVFAKVVLTAVSKMMASNQGGRGKSSGSSNANALQDIPVIGAYPVDMEWSDILQKVGKNLAMVLAFWLIIQLIIGLINFLIGGVAAPGA